MPHIDEHYAFPWTVEDKGNSKKVCTGMTLRDYFAGQALVGFCNTYQDGCWRDHDGAPGETARMAWKIADAMMKAREQQG